MKKHFITTIALAASLAALAASAPAQTNQTDKVETKEQRDARMAWWREAKFGLFIHWGVYSVPAGYYHDKPVRRHRRMDHEQRQNSDGGIPAVRQGI